MEKTQTERQTVTNGVIDLSLMPKELFAMLVECIVENADLAEEDE